MVKNPPTNAGDLLETSSILGLGRSSGEWHGNLLQYSCLENPMDRGAWWITAHGVTKSQTRLKQQQAGTLKLLNDLEGIDSFTIFKLLIHEHLHLL